MQAAPFADDFLDIATLNAHVSTYLLDRVEAVRAAAMRGESVSTRAVAVLGPAGGGKTHVFARMRHRSASRATLILLRPYFGVSLSLRDVLAGVVDQLCLPIQGGSATHLDLFAQQWLDDGDGDRVERAVAAIVALVPETAPAAHLARAILELGARDGAARWGELAWLSGREPRATEAGASTGPLSERDVLHVLRLLAVMAAPVAPLIITLDQLENLAGDDDARVLGYGNLVSEMVDTLPSLTIVQLALTSEWMQFIEPRLSLPHRTRVAHETFALKLPTRQERELLLRAWHDRLAPKNGGGRKRRFPAPLLQDELDTLLAAPGMTPRILLTALSRKLGGQPIFEVPATRTSGPRAVDPWEVERARVEHDIDEKERAGLPFDAAELAEGLTSALSFVPRLDVATSTERDRLLTAVKSPGHELTILFLTSLHHASVGAALGKAAELAQTTKLVVVREKRFELPRSWEAVHERRSAFERLPNARWLWLEREDVARSLTLARVLSQSRAGKLRDPASDAPRSLEDLRRDIERARAPHEWQSVASVTRWLSDVPRSADPVEARPPAREEAPRAKKSVPFEPVPALREWIGLGRDLGRAAAGHYLGRLRAIVRRAE